LEQAVELSAAQQVPLAMHLAESLEELELLMSASGPLRQLLADLGAWDPTAIPRGIRPGDYLQILSRAHRALIIHGNFLTSDEIGLLAAGRDRLSVVYCPRTHARLGHGAYPLAEVLAAGVNVALGTDSRASNPDLSLLAEMRWVYRHHPAISPEQIIRMGTVDGAHALGLSAVAGTLTPGKRAGLAVIPLPPNDGGDPYELLLAGEGPALSPGSRACHCVPQQPPQADAVT
jgi:cytosine/adenosine deaminase-related metal-dependent hydrolase